MTSAPVHVWDVTVKSAAAAPPMVSAEIASGAPPVFATVTERLAVAPPLTVPNARLVGVSVMVGLAAAAPVPVSTMV